MGILLHYIKNLTKLWPADDGKVSSEVMFSKFELFGSNFGLRVDHLKVLKSKTYEICHILWSGEKFFIIKIKWSKNLNV